MKNSFSRRRFIQNVSTVTAGLAAVSAVPAFTSASKEQFNSYVPGAPFSNDLRTNNPLCPQVKVEGKIQSNRDISMSDVQLEVWHLSPDSKQYGHRATIKVESDGSYQFLTDYPNNETGKQPCIHFRIGHSTDSYDTKLIIGKDFAFITDDHWLRNHKTVKNLFPKKKRELNQIRIKFDLSI